MTTSVAIVENGAISFEPTEITYRTISYYLDATLTKMLQPSNNVVSAPARDSGNANVKSVPQQTIVAPLQMTRRSPITLTGQSFQPMVADVRNVSFINNSKVTVDNAPSPPERPSRPPVSGGVLNGSAISLPAPVYPETARRMHASGTVEVEVVIDENGKVSSAKAITGPGAFRDSAVQAALRARFTPSKLSGQAVRVTGKIVYVFKLPQ
jgi:protein TonB